MELISKLLFWVANSLLIPDIIILLCLFVRSLILIGGTYNMYMTKRKNDKALDQLIKDARIDDLKAALPDKDNSLYMGYLRDLLYHPASADYSDFLITKFENEAEKDVSLSKMLAKIGPVLGLIGTLISMSPALVGLSTGDISGMAYNMQVVFATTVVGLVISAVGLISMQFKQRWYAKDVNNLDYVSRVLNETTGEYYLVDSDYSRTADGASFWLFVQSDRATGSDWRDCCRYCVRTFRTRLFLSGCFSFPFSGTLAYQS